MTIHGTVTKSAVATGADLVGYSGFSASNHLAQPYNSDLDFGSGSYSVVAWFKTESSGAGSGVITGLGNNTDEVMLVYVASSYGIYFDYGTASVNMFISLILVIDLWLETEIGIKLYAKLQRGKLERFMLMELKINCTKCYSNYILIHNGIQIIDYILDVEEVSALYHLVVLYPLLDTHYLKCHQNKSRRCMTMRKSLPREC